MNSRVIFREDSLFEVHWDLFLKSNKHSSPFYLLNWMAYQRLYSEDRFVKDLSFIYLIDEQPAAICPLYLENYNGIYRFSYRGEFLESLRTPLIGKFFLEKHGKSIEKELYELIDKLADLHHVKKGNFIIDPLSAIQNEEYYNHLTRYSYIDVSISTQIIHLKKSREALWTDLRKSYKALINKAAKTFELVIMDYTNADFEIHEIYRALHFKAAGRVTRPLSTFNKQFDMLKNDESMLLGVKYQGQFVCMSYFVHGANTAYYSSEADDPTIEIPLTCGPFSQWKAIEYYKDRGIEYLELDNQQFGPQFFDYPTKKELMISMFKRGFGGFTYPLFRGVRYYDKELMQIELRENVELLIKELYDVE